MLEFKAGQVLFTQGEGPTFLGVVLSGSVDLVFQSHDARGDLHRAKLATVGPGARTPAG